MRALLRRISFSYIGFVLLLIAAALLGVFITLFASDGASGWTITYGVATAVVLATALACMRFQVVESTDNEPGDEMVINAQPLIPSEERSEIIEYQTEHPHRHPGMTDER